MKIAICMSGLTRTFKLCYQSYLDNIISQYDCDVFTVVSLDNNSKDIDLIKQTKKVIVDNEPLHDEKDYILYKARKTNRYSIQGWLSQFWKIKMCHRLMMDYQKEKAIKYDWVIRCRPDLLITRKIDDLNSLNKEYLYIPVNLIGSGFDKDEFYKEDYVYDYVDSGIYSYLPDQFAIGSVEFMQAYADRYDDLDHISHSEKNYRFCAEYSLPRQLKYHNIKIKFLRPLTGIQRAGHLVSRVGDKNK